MSPAAVSRWALAIGLLALPGSSQAQYQLAGRLTEPGTNLELDSGAQAPSISYDGGVIAFASSSSNLGAPSNGSLNIYLYDIGTNTYYLAQAGLGTGNSTAPSVAARIFAAVAFESGATDLVADPQSSQDDVFYSVLTSENPATFSTFLVSRGIGGTAANAASRYASISADGRWIAFFSDASNLIANDTNGAPDIFVADANNLASPPERISVAGAGDQINGPSRPLSPNAVSADGRYVVFAVDTPVSIDGSNPNTLEDVFLRDRQNGTTSLISKRTDGQPSAGSSSSPAISPGGRYVVFLSFATDLVQSPSGSRIYLRDRELGTTTNMPLPPGASSCEDPRVSDGARITVQCAHSGAAQAWLYDPAQGGSFFQMSASTTGGNGNNASGNFTGISANGLIAVFDSSATNLLDDGDTNAAPDVFVVVPEPGATGAAVAALGLLAGLARRGRGSRRD
jgi:Tol biopolymer transport system component